MRALRLQTWLVLLVTTAALLTFSLVGAAILIYRLPQIEAEGRRQAQLDAEKIASLTEQFLGGVEDQLAPLAELSARLPPAALQPYLDAIVGRSLSFDAVSIVDADGRVRAIGLPPERRAAAGDLLNADLSANRLFLAARNTAAAPAGARAAATWSDRYLSFLHGDIAIGLAIRAGSHIVIGELSRQRLLDMMHGFHHWGDPWVAVIDSRGQWLGETRPVDIAAQHINRAALPTFQAIVAGAPLPPYEIVAGKRLLPGGTVSPRLGWVFASGAPAGLDSPAYRITLILVVLGFFGSTVISLALAPFWAARMERPIGALIEYAHRIAAMDYRDRPPGRGSVAELNQLGADLALMAQAIGEREEQMRTLNAELEERVARRTRDLSIANDELKAALEKLGVTHAQLVQSEKLAALGNLVAGVAHELNTPIGNALMAVSTLADAQAQFRAALAAGLRRSDLDAFLQSATTASDIGARNLYRAADLIASFKQVAVDQTSDQRRRFHLAEVVREIVVTLQPTLRRTPYTIVTSVADDIELDSFPGALGQVLTNLIDNAVLHGFAGRDHGVIRIVAQGAGADAVRLSIGDDGRGISAEMQKRVFEPFFTTRLGQGGSGLGLHIVFNTVANILGGTIALDSQEGRGTTFTLELPRTAPRHTGPGAGGEPPHQASNSVSVDSSRPAAPARTVDS